MRMVASSSPPIRPWRPGWCPSAPAACGGTPPRSRHSRTSSRRPARAPPPSSLPRRRAPSCGHHRRRRRQLRPLTPLGSSCTTAAATPRHGSRALVVPSRSSRGKLCCQPSANGQAKNLLPVPPAAASVPAKNSGGGGKLPGLSRKLLFQKGPLESKKKALTEVKNNGNANKRTLAMVLRSERELLSQSKEQEDEIAALHLRRAARSPIYLSPLHLPHCQWRVEWTNCGCRALARRLSGSRTCACGSGRRSGRSRTPCCSRTRLCSMVGGWCTPPSNTGRAARPSGAITPATGGQGLALIDDLQGTHCYIQSTTRKRQQSLTDVWTLEPE